MKGHPMRHSAALAAATLFLLMGILNGCAYLVRSDEIVSGPQKPVWCNIEANRRLTK
jgi:hypothetical protein